MEKKEQQERGKGGQGLQVGLTGKLKIKVTQEDTARALGSGTLPVLGTPRLLALVEETAWKSVASFLSQGEGTVGTAVKLSHLAPTPVGMEVICETKLTEIDRRKLVFSFAVFDEREKIAEGTHERFLIAEDKFLTKAEGKL